MNKARIIFWILIFVILLNTLLGYPYSNILIGIIPVNEILLGFTIFIIFKEIPKLLVKYKLFLPLIILSVCSIIRAILDSLEYGLWAFRDVMHFIEIWWILPTIYIFEKDIKNIFRFHIYLYKLGLIFIIFKFLAIFTKPYSEIIKIEGFQHEMPLLTSMSSLGFLAFFLFLYAIFFIKSTKKKLISIFTFLLFVILVQSRNVYLSILGISLAYFLFLKFSLKKFFKIIGYLILILLILTLISKMTFLNNYARFGIENVNPAKIIYHLYTITGKSLDTELSGPAKGVIQRLEWWSNIYNKLTSSIYSLFFGLGFGVPLTDFVTPTGQLVREPHNSFISTLARVGIFGFLVWFSIISYIIIKSLIYIKHYYKKYKQLPLVLPFTFTFIYVFFLALSEPPFELPFEATVIYIMLGTIYFYIKNWKI